MWTVNENFEIFTKPFYRSQDSIVKTLQKRELGLRSGPAKNGKYNSSAPPFNSYEKVKILLDLAKVTSSQQATQLDSQ